MQRNKHTLPIIILCIAFAIFQIFDILMIAYYVHGICINKKYSDVSNIKKWFFKNEKEIDYYLNWVSETSELQFVSSEINDDLSICNAKFKMGVFYYFETSVDIPKPVLEFSSKFKQDLGVFNIDKYGENIFFTIYSSMGLTYQIIFSPDISYIPSQHECIIERFSDYIFLVEIS